MAEKEKVEAIDSLVEVCIKEERFENALEAAKLGASQKAIDSVVEAYIKRKRYGENDALEAAKLGASQKAIDSVVEAFIKRKDDDIGRVYYALEAVKLGASQKAIDSVVEVCAHNYFTDHALNAIKLGASQKAIDSLVEAYIKKGRIADVRKLLGRDLTVEEIEKLKKAIK